MKKLCLLFCCFFAAALSAAEPLFAELSYRLTGNDQAEVTINVSGKGRPTLDFPAIAGGYWQKNKIFEENSIRSSFINGKISTVHSFTYTLPLILTQESSVTIPPVVVSLDGERTQTEPVTLPDRKARLQKIRDMGEDTIDLSQVTATLFFTGGKDRFVGETIEFLLEIAMPIPARLADVSLPDFSGTKNVVFLKRGNMMLVAQEPARRGDLRIYRFTGVIKVMKSGTFPTDAQLKISLRIPRKEQGFGDFFYIGGRRASTIAYDVVCQSKEKSLNIIPLPPLPSGAYDLALGGNWQIQSHFSPEKGIRTGDAMTLVIAGQGDRSAASLHAPKLHNDKFRIYPPEVKKDGNRFKIEYALIPLSAGEVDLDFPLAVFDPAAGKYQLFHAKTKLDVAKGAAVVPEKASQLEQNIPGSAPVAQGKSFFYPRNVGENLVKMPLLENIRRVVFVTWGIALVTAALAFAWCQRRIFSPAWYRQLQKRQLHQLVKDADDETLASQLPGAIGALLVLPPGATTAEIAEEIDDPVVLDALEKCGQSDFMPGSSAWHPDRKTRSLLWRHIKKLGIFFAVLLPLLTMADHALFDAGRFDEAAKEYEKKMDSHLMDVDLLYNIGAAHFHAGNWAMSRLALRRAHLLGPRDREIARHLAEVEEKLQLPAVKHASVSQIVDRVIGVMRPDEWMFSGALVVAGMLVLLGFFPLLSSAWRGTLSAIAIFWLVLSFVAIQQEKSRLYSPDLAMTVSDIALRSLPSETSGRADAYLPAGSDLRILEFNGNWLLVESPKGRGWVSTSQVARLFPGGLW